MINLNDKYAMFDNGTFDTIMDECGVRKEIFSDDWGNYYMNHFVVVEINKRTHTIWKCDRIKYTFNEVAEDEGF